MTEREPGARDEDELWRSIVDNYGDRPELPTDEPAAPGHPTPEHEPSVPAYPPDPDDRFVPPTPAPVPLPERQRLVAWLGLFVSPLLLLAMAVTGVRVFQLVGLGLVAWFVVGFGYLVATMPRGPRDPDDDGAVV